ncbi:rho guanine nucleotide exchange factor 18-like isoform X3 [Megalops cyprinoides]|uniref:rho guanine nucleotide exchange factor 18-like isoform X3 n=1 Tax=Megalops cyprinoides TaxID=118141 RepID=UPI001864E511|nr:rho guanine nucleotide exchange factor 18-like isoform X3 [Megalops cyprinoides]
MSTSRRHSWSVPLSPLEPGRRLSLETPTVESDGEREDGCSPQSLTCPPDLGQSFSFPECPRERRLGQNRPPGGKPKKPNKPGRSSSLRSEILASETSQAAHVSRVLETSKRAAGSTGAEGQELGVILQTKEGQSHVLMVQTVLQELKQYHGAKQRTTSRGGEEHSSDVTWFEFLSNEPGTEEEQAEKLERGAKVRRTLSSLRNRVTGSFGKDKGKQKEQQKERERDRELKEKEKERLSSYGHQLVPGTFSSWTTCSVCSKSLQGKQQCLQCLNCAVNVHKSCRSLLPECSRSKRKVKDSPYRRTGAVQSTVQFYNQALREQRHLVLPSAHGHSAVPHRPGMTLTPQGHSTQPAMSAHHRASSGSIQGEMDEADSTRFKRLVEDTVSLTPSSAESISLEEDQFAALRGELESEAQDFEIESWSLAVDPQFSKTYHKVAIKRQDVIYELIQTEMHHVRTLRLMLQVYAAELREVLQLEEEKVERLFPQAENLLHLHRHFLLRLKERRRESLQPGSERNYAIQRLGDILTAQFSGETGDRLKESYGDFCSRHTEAVGYYKEQMQSNKKFQNVIRKISNLSIVRRLGVPECILLVTQRITKYPVLVERILQNTEAGTEEHQELTQALGLIKDVITQVDGQVNEYEKAVRLRDIAAKIEPKSQGKIKDGRVFRREDLTQGRRRLLHEGTVNWKAASGRLKDILAVLLSDVLLLLQEKDQKYVFSTVDGKPSVISLQKLIVREVAHEEKAMFLICASSADPEMYEIHTSSKEECGTWMALIRQAVESCPDVEEELFSEQEETRVAQLRELQERLTQKDLQIIHSLTEKLQIFSDIAAIVTGVEDVSVQSRLLLRGDASDLQQGEQLLLGAISDVEDLQNLLISGVRESPSRVEGSQGGGSLPRRADTFGGYDSNPTFLNKAGTGGGVWKKTCGGDSVTRERGQRARSDPLLKELHAQDGQEQLVDEGTGTSWNPIWSNSFPEEEFFDRVLTLSQRLYTLKAIVVQQDTQMELQRALGSERDGGRGAAARLRGSSLLEQEKQRNLERQKEEVASFERQRARFRQECAQWEREREQQARDAEARAAQLREQEDGCLRAKAELEEEKRELKSKWEDYQKDLERLRESTRSVERDREQLDREREQFEQQKRLKKSASNLGSQGLPHATIFNGDILLGPKSGDPVPVPHLRPALSVTPADYAERPPEVPRRRESMAPVPPKPEVPLHLHSTRNQGHKQGAVQQQIPTKLAVNTRKEKGGKKSSQRTESSASLDFRQMLPMKLSGKEDGSLRGRRSVSPHQPYQPDPVPQPNSFPDLPPPPLPAHSPSFRKNSGPAPPYKVAEEVAKEDVIFF